MPRLLFRLLLLAFLHLTFLPPATADCIPCRYGASTVVCPQPAGVDPAGAMTDFNCLCSHLSAYLSTLASCYKNSDLPSSCSPTDEGEYSRIRSSCQAPESPSVITERIENGATKTETVRVADAQTVVVVTPDGGRRTTLVTSVAGAPGPETFLVTYYTAGSRSGQAGGSTWTPWPSTTTGSGGGGVTIDGDPGSGAGKYVGTIIGATIGGVLGIILFGFGVVEIQKRRKVAAENRRVTEELKEAIRFGGNGDGAAEFGHEEVATSELPATERLMPAELAEDEIAAELKG